MEQLPPVYDFRTDQAGFDRHVAACLAEPCQHCEQIAPTYERLSLKFAVGRPPKELICSACGNRRGAYYPTS